MLSSWKKIKISTILLSLHNIIVIIINLFGQEFNVSECSAQWKIFVIACAFDTVFLMAVIVVACHYQFKLLTYAFD